MPERAEPGAPRLPSADMQRTYTGRSAADMRRSREDDFRDPAAGDDIGAAADAAIDAGNEEIRQGEEAGASSADEGEPFTARDRE